MGEWGNGEGEEEVGADGEKMRDEGEEGEGRSRRRRESGMGRGGGMRGRRGRRGEKEKGEGKGREKRIRKKLFFLFSPLPPPSPLLHSQKIASIHSWFLTGSLSFHFFHVYSNPFILQMLCASVYTALITAGRARAPSPRPGRVEAHQGHLLAQP